MENALVVKPSVSMLPYNGSPKQIEAKQKFNDKVFNDCQKNVSKAEVRDADWGLYAAQICLAKDLIGADYDQSKLITAKMEFLQKIINQNMDQDQQIYVQDEDLKIKNINAKADAKVKVIPVRAAAITGTMNAGSNAVDSLSNAAVKSADLIKTVKSPATKEVIDLIA